MANQFRTSTEAWQHVVGRILKDGYPVISRGKGTLERQDISFSFAMDQPIMQIPARSMNYKFMAAEADWITTGSNQVEDLIKYNSKMAQFSDDGVILSGAYGIPFKEQFAYVIKCLLNDPFTRQAALTIWKPDPYPSKDIPCTIAMVFSIRNGEFNSHVFMRSSDAWLGLPYDMFSFAMMALQVLCEYNKVTKSKIKPGHVFMSLVSSHLYDEHVALASDIIHNFPDWDHFDMPSWCWMNWDMVEAHLRNWKDGPQSSFVEFKWPD
jgi:thymidylate synthase